LSISDNQAIKIDFWL